MLGGHENELLHWFHLLAILQHGLEAAIDGHLLPDRCLWGRQSLLSTPSLRTEKEPAQAAQRLSNPWPCGGFA